MMKENSDTEEILKNVEHSTESALLALSQLEKNLLNSRFKEGISAYDSMCKTLVGQRIWASTKNSEKVDMNFKKISITAKSIIDILQPYVQSLQKLSNIDTQILVESEGVTQIIRSSLYNNQDSENILTDQEKVLSAIKSSRKGQISYTRLCSLFGWERKKLDKVLNGMTENDKSISISMAGSRKMVFLTSK